VQNIFYPGAEWPIGQPEHFLVAWIAYTKCGPLAILYSIIEYNFINNFFNNVWLSYFDLLVPMQFWTIL